MATKAPTGKYDSKAGSTGAKNYIKVTLLLEAVKGRYASKPLTAKEAGESLDDWLSDDYGDGNYGRFRVQAETITLADFDKSYDS